VIDPDRVPLEARGVIGDTASAALVSADGTIDWYCPGRIDAPAALFRILDPADGAAVRIGPAGLGPSARRRLPPGGQRYDPATNVLRTRLSGPDGEIEIADVMPWPGGTERPPGRIVRLVTALRGPIEVEIEVVPGRAFGPAAEISTWSQGMAFDRVAVRTGLPFTAIPTGPDRAVWQASQILQPGDQLVVTIDDLADDHHRPLSPDAALSVVAATAEAWRRHVFPVTYGGPYGDAVLRSLLAIKLLQWYAGGGVAAAATLSLPEVAGGERNEDRRWVWLRDTAQSATLFDRIGLGEDALAARSWLRTVMEGSAIPLVPAFDVEGGPTAPEEELGLPGRLQSEPVRIGTRWWRDDPPPGLQLDVYGDLLASVELDGGPLTAVWKELASHADWLADHWAAPDHGVWELRGEPRMLVASRVQCWYALDRMVRLARARNPLDLDAVGWQQAAGDIGRWLERNGVAADDGLRLDDQPADLPDAALLRVAWRGPWPAHGSPRVGHTVDRILLQLSTGALIHRYPPELDDGLPGIPGADLTASFWAVRALAALGRWEEAHERMDTLCGLGQPLGVLSEMLDPISGHLFGNTPSARVHLALIDAAVALEGGPR
jgi:GH15 family glucan-1,4-alpha-glucosidase